MSHSRPHKKQTYVDHPTDNHSCLSESVRTALENYFADLDGHEATDLYELIMSQVEKPLFEVVMENTRGNITRAADLLGINRGTLRSRLKKYGLE
jgi:Fis family transcriptional regulator, factor for inversion stimulation protein